MVKKIAVTGTHGTGKTTLAFQLAVEYKKMGHNVKIVQEVARSCPFPLNKDMTKDTALWIYHAHMVKELEAARTHDVVICDRTFYDSFVYAKCNRIDLGELPWNLKLDLGNHYDQIFFVQPDMAIKEDGVRSVDYDFQQKVHEHFGYALCSIERKELKSSQIFDEKHSWKQFCL